MGHKSLLKAVLTKSTATMAERRVQSGQSKSQAMYVCALTDQYCRVNRDFDINQMNVFLVALREIVGDTSGSISVNSPAAEVRFDLEGAIPLLMQVLQIECPATYATLSAINWRLLFSIEAETPVQIVVIPGSDDDSGGASLETSESSST